MRTHIYEAEMLSVLNVVPESFSPEMRTISILMDCCDHDMREHIRKRCEEAAAMIQEFFGPFRASVNVYPSRRGKNYFDFVMKGPLKEAFLLEVVLADNKTGMHNITYRMPYGRLMDILLEDTMSQEERASLRQRWTDIADIIDGHTDMTWQDMPGGGDTIFTSVRKLLTDTALCLQRHGSGLMSVLWNHFYLGAPVLRITFAKGRIFLQLLDPLPGYLTRSSVIEPTLHGDGVWECNGNDSVRVRIPGPGGNVAAQNLTACISFNFPDGLDGIDSYYNSIVT